jgi:hypothetical protein
MKFLCECGHTIRDQTDYLPYKALFLRDEDREPFLNAVEAIVRERLADAPDGTAPWKFPLACMRAVVAYTLHIYECEACGRLWVEQKRGSDQLVEFIPASGRPERVLASPRGSPVRAPGEFRPLAD